MANITQDIERLHKVLDGTLNEKWDSIFSRSNEDLNGILMHVDVLNTDIYSVLSSSDMLFYCLLNDARSVDTFDINPLTYRYYYFRKWLLENGLIDATNLSLEEIKIIVEQRKDSINIDEKESYLFWNHYLDLRSKWRFHTEHLFQFYNHYLFENSYYAPSFSKNSDDIKALSDKLDSTPLNFKQGDILFDAYIVSEKKYDIVYLSNILDLTSHDSIENARRNVYSLLKNGGIVLCTNMRNHPYFDTFGWQKDVFSEYFEYEELFTEERGTNNIVKYYKYIKK